MPEEPTKRLFFALYPSVLLREAIMRSINEDLPHSVKTVPIDNIHLTLMFMGSCTLSQQSDYIAAAETVHVQGFKLELDYLDQFNKAKILWLGARQVPAELLRLYAALSDALKLAGYDSSPQTYRPHVTMARNFRGDVPAYSKCIRWNVESFSLMESRSTDQGVRYIELESWPLG